MPALLRSHLGVVCPSCDFLNAIGAHKCMTCGSVTDASAPAVRTEKHQGHVPPPPAVAAVPPGLKRAHTAPSLAAIAPAPPPPAVPAPAPVAATPPAAPPTEPLGVAPTTASGVVRALAGSPARPTFQSSAAPPPQAAGPKFGLSVVAGPARGQRFRLGISGAQVGRSKGVILFPDDPFVSPLHATLTSKDGKLVVRDEASTSGVYVSINGHETISPDSYFATGLRLFHYLGAIEPAPPVVQGRLQIYGAPLPANQPHYSLEEILLGARPGRTVITGGPIVTVGQAKCDLSFPNDEGMAPRHCELTPTATGATIRDLSGGLGTYVRVSGERALKAGDRVRIGQQTLQVELLN